MRAKVYDDTAPRAPVSVRINGDLHAEVQEVGLDIDAIAERALAAALRERLREEIERDLDAVHRYVAEHGSFAGMLGEHHAETEDREAV